MSFDDPFAGAEKAPSVKWGEVPVGGVVKFHVDEPAKLVQSRDFETGEPAFWDDARTQPKMAAVLNGTVDGERRSIWAQKPSALFAAIGEAQSKAGERIDAGGVLYVKRLDDKPNAKNPRLKPQHQFTAKYEAPAKDAFGSDSEDEQIPF